MLNVAPCFVVVVPGFVICSMFVFIGAPAFDDASLFVIGVPGVCYCCYL